MTATDRSGGQGALAAVVFDLDGVLTTTASLHAAAWKDTFDGFLRSRAERTGEPFVPFDVLTDYRPYVDGRPRYDGVATFLASRGIELPWGDPSDPAEAQTVCGVGNRKNLRFNERVDREGVTVFDDARRALDRLQAAGVRLGLHSSSRNTRRVLAAAGLADRFEVVVDGNDLAELGLPGKPDPAPFREAVFRMGIAPIDAAVVEDAVSGVRSGRRGGFGLVVGVARGTNDPDALARAGADVVVASLDDLPADPREWRRLGADPARPLDAVPEATAEGVLERLDGRRPIVFCDFDGTLSEIVNDPDAATITVANRHALAHLAQQCPVAVVSGRAAGDVARRVELDGLYVAGSHGFELLTPEGELREQERAQAALPELEAARDELGALLAGVPGALVEDKHYAIAVHYRNVDPAEHDRVRTLVADQARHRHLATSGGKMVAELRPPLPWDKGAAMVDLLERIAPGEEAAPVYVGDDLTDEDAFRVLRGWGVGVAVRGGDHPTAADLAVDDPSGVARLLDDLASALAARS